jgi:hypothetical protein
VYVAKVLFLFSLNCLEYSSYYKYLGVLFDEFSTFKNNIAKSVGNEYIKSSIHIMLPLYEKLFNIIFTTGKLPARWFEGNIIPIHKK